jgi:hypothetical protein
MSNRSFINMLKSGNQEPVTLLFHNLRLKDQFAGFVSKKIEADSVSILRLLDSAKFAEQYGFTTDNIYTVLSLTPTSFTGIHRQINFLSGCMPTMKNFGRRSVNKKHLS